MESCKECNEKADLVSGLCPDCLEETFICFSCEKRYDNDIKLTIDDEDYCEECVDDNFTMCYHCEETVADDETTIVNNKNVCESCLDSYYSICNRCEDYVHIDNGFSYHSGTLCMSCYEHDYFTCSGCDEIWHLDEHVENGYCTNCHKSSCLHDYSYKPEPIFYGKSKENLFFGIELEIESNGHSIEDAVYDLSEFLYAKSDGTIDDGFEAVSHPASWDWLVENNDKWNKILDLRKNGFNSYNTNTCGMHIHISKRAFGSLHLYKFLKLFFENQEFILTVSRRKKHLLEEYASLETDESIVYKARIKNSSQRYTAINLQNRDTVEIRVFRGTLSPTGFWRNLEFCMAAYNYTKNESVKNISADNLCRFIEKNKTEYFNLFKFFEEKKLCV